MRSEIAFVVSVVSQFIHKPKEMHLKAFTQNPTVFEGYPWERNFVQERRKHLPEDLY